MRCLSKTKINSGLYVKVLNSLQSNFKGVTFLTIARMHACMLYLQFAMERAPHSNSVFLGWINTICIQLLLTGTET